MLPFVLIATVFPVRASFFVRSVELYCVTSLSGSEVPQTNICY